MNKKEAGNKGEIAAKEYYVSKGYTVVTTNYRFRRSGEIDLILRKQDMLVFCEVKYRTNPDVFSPAAAVTPTKIRKIRTVAQAFLQANQTYLRYEIRFDVAEVFPEEGKLKVSLIENAF